MKQDKEEGYNLANKLGHSIIKPIPSIFTFKIDDIQLTELSGASLKLESLKKNIPQLTQVGPMLVTHWGLSGPVILCLSAWGPVIFLILFIKARNQFLYYLFILIKQKVGRSYPHEYGTMKRFWKYLLNREGIDEDILWASISNNSLMSIATLLKQCSFLVKRKVFELIYGQFKDEFVTARGVPLSEVPLFLFLLKIFPFAFIFLIYFNLSFFLFLFAYFLKQILHGFIGLVRSPISATLPQISSRLYVVWGILYSFPEVQTHPIVSYLVISWSITEIIRYSFFGTKEAFGSTPYWLLWLSEIAMIYNALPYMKESEKYSIRMPNKWNFSFDYFYFAFVVLATL
uniref:very-long-chain (3R)-3-hydroxyacyl-CoA dehydratase n=1 Tax=Lactuca sativa TaxID=4236 RepID=A0A9R1VBJ1_LACSA|nr:hypothetical protein LSAT_V11C600327290 [Lactuca sativa]